MLFQILKSRTHMGIIISSTIPFIMTSFKFADCYHRDQRVKGREKRRGRRREERDDRERRQRETREREGAKEKERKKEM